MKRKKGRKRRRKKSGSGKIQIAIMSVIVILLMIALAMTIYWIFFGGSQKNKSAGDAGENSEQAEIIQNETEESKQSDETEDKDAEKEQPEREQSARIGQIMEDMTLEEKVCQLFMITPEALTGVETATQAGDMTKEALNAYPVGGIIYFAQNLIDPDQTKSMLANTQQYAMDRSGFPVFLSVDEEGGEVARIGNNPAFGVPSFENMSDVGAEGDTQKAYQIGSQIGSYLKNLGFNMDAAPDADVLTNPSNEVVRYRSFGSDPKLVADMAGEELRGLTDQGIIGMYKHFPGHGGTAADSHEGYAYVDDTFEKMKSQALIPFQDGIDKGVKVIMVSHISCPNVTGNNTPATLSEKMVTDILRHEMGFNGVVITDALNMGAITEQYTPDQAAVSALSAGVDMLLMPSDFQTAYNGVINAVQRGTLTEERINESVERILEIKMDMME